MTGTVRQPSLLAAALDTPALGAQELLDSLSQSIFLKDRDLRFVAINQAFCAGLGKNPQDVLGQDDFAFYPAALAEKYRADDQRVLREGIRLETEEQNLRDGQACTVRVVKTPVRGPGGGIDGVLGIFWDITEQRRLESHIRQAQKMDAVAQLAGGIAHDFNNLLTCILGNIALAQGELRRLGNAGVSALEDFLGNVDMAGQRAADLTRQLLGFSRRLHRHPEPLDLNASVHEAVRACRGSVDPRTVVQLRLEPKLWKTHADPAQIHQALLNLCYNATDAMPLGGHLTLETANVTLMPPTALPEIDAENKSSLVLPCAHPDSRPGDFVRLRVSDTGEGISADVLPHIFEPFFTTKAFGKGSGLALAMVYGVIKEHEGWIECHSQAGLGTQFDLFLPRMLVSPRGPTDGELLSGQETVLLVDEHQVIRALGHEILESYGYRVLTATNGATAVELFRQHHRRIDLVLLDLSGPRQTGQDTLQAMRQIKPDMRLLICAGFPLGPALRAVEQCGAAGFIAKPYQPLDLARSVRAALDRGRAESYPQP